MKPNIKAWIYSVFLITLVLIIASIIFLDARKDEGDSPEEALQEIVE